MQLRGHFIGASTSAFVSIARASRMFPAANQMPAECSNFSQLHAAR